MAVLGGLLEATKLVMAGWLAANWRVAGALLRLVMALLVAGLVTVNGAGVFAWLIESHLSIATAASTSVGERIGILDAGIAEQGPPDHHIRHGAGIEAQDREIADAVAKMTSAGKAKSAIAATEAQQKRRDAIAEQDRPDVAATQARSASRPALGHPAGRPAST